VPTEAATSLSVTIPIWGVPDTSRRIVISCVGVAAQSRTASATGHQGKP
jgi:hypothetical protein